jgi:hypothetical protein
MVRNLKMTNVAVFYILPVLLAFVVFYYSDLVLAIPSLAQVGLFLAKIKIIKIKSIM